MASVFKRKNKGPYIVAWFDAEGIRREKSSRTTDYRAALQLAGKLEADAMLRREGVIDLRQDRFAAEARRPIGEHLDEFKAGLSAKA